MKALFNKKKLQYGAASVIFVAVFVAVVIVLNIFASFLTERFSLKIDMTAEGKYSLSTESVDMLKKIENPVKIYILSSRSEMEKDASGSRTLETVMRYGSESGGKITYEFIDPKKNPQFFNKFPLAKKADPFDLVVEGPERYLVVNASEFEYRIVGDKNTTYYVGEEKISAAILYTSSREVSDAGVVVGHGEIRPETLLDHFEGNHFNVQDVDLLDGIPANVKNLVISAPAIDFTKEEIAELEKYLAVGGNNLYVFWSMDTPKLPSIETYLSEWGISFEAAVVCDDSNAYMTKNIAVADLAETHVMDKSLQQEMYVIIPEARPIVLSKPHSGYIRTASLIETRNTSYAKIISADKPISSFSRESGDTKGPFVVAAIAERALGTTPEEGVSGITVFGSYGVAVDEICDVERAFNRTFFAHLTEYTNPNTQVMEIAPKVATIRNLNITEAEAKLFRVILIAIIPSVIILAAIYVFIKRKNR